MFKEKFYRSIWFVTGCLLLGVAYLGVILPGLPWSTPTVGAAFCFAKSSARMHNWLYNHKLFGPFLTNWKERRVFPTKMKYAMLATMSASLLMMWISTNNLIAVGALFVILAAVAVWSWKYPGSVADYEHRVQNQLPISWFR